MAAVGLRSGPAGGVAAWVAEDPAGEHDEALGWRLEVDVPAGFGEHVRERLGQLSGAFLGGLKLQDSPDAGLLRGGAARLETADLADGQPQIVQRGPDPQAFRDQRAVDHGPSSWRHSAGTSPKPISLPSGSA